jgi:hypothetical protein
VGSRRKEANVQAKNGPIALSEISKVQLQQCVETYRVQMSLLVQICTVFILADATMVGYALQQQLAGALLVGIVFPLAMLVVMRVVVRMTIPVLAAAIAIETKYKDSDAPGFVSTFVSTAISFALLEQIRAAVVLSTEQARARALADLSRPYSFSGSRLIKHALMLIIVAQAIVPILLWHFAGWSLLHK